MNDKLQPNSPDPMTFITEAVADLGVYLAMWGRRGEAPTPAERTAASLAVDRIDAVQTRLYRLRAQLVGQVRDTRDQAAANLLLRRLYPTSWTDTGSGPGHDEPRGMAWERHDDPTAE